MARLLSIEYPGALYHVISQENARENIFLSDNDYSLFLRILSLTVGRYQFLMYTYFFMDNHHHLLVETPKGNLAAGHVISLEEYKWSSHRETAGFQK